MEWGLWLLGNTHLFGLVLSFLQCYTDCSAHCIQWCIRRNTRCQSGWSCRNQTYHQTFGGRWDLGPQNRWGGLKSLPYLLPTPHLYKQSPVKDLNLWVQLLQALDSFVVVEREGQIIACAALFPFFQDKCGEVAAIAVASDCRGQGQGDKLLGKVNQTKPNSK